MCSMLRKCGHVRKLCGVICLSMVCDPIHRLLGHQSEAVLGTTSHIWIIAQFASVCETIYIVKSAPRHRSLGLPQCKSVPSFRVSKSVSGETYCHMDGILSEELLSIPKNGTKHFTSKGLLLKFPQHIFFFEFPPFFTFWHSIMELTFVSHYNLVKEVISLTFKSS